MLVIPAGANNGQLPAETVAPGGDGNIHAITPMSTVPPSGTPFKKWRAHHSRLFQLVMRSAFQVFSALRDLQMVAEWGCKGAQTRVSPFKEPVGSFRWRAPKSAIRRGNSRYDLSDFMM